jgi:enoyl-CoA hydratase/carnithine racemase
MGLVQYVTEPGKQLEKAMELARKVVSAAPLGVRNILQNARLAEREGEQAAKKTIYQDVAKVMQSEDMREGLQSFIERRTAVFKGK